MFSGRGILLVMFSRGWVQTAGEQFCMECSPAGAARERENTARMGSGPRRDPVDHQAPRRYPQVPLRDPLWSPLWSPWGPWGGTKEVPKRYQRGTWAPLGAPLGPFGAQGVFLHRFWSIFGSILGAKMVPKSDKKTGWFSVPLFGGISGAF